MHGLRHVLDPGTPGYSALRVGAIGGFFVLQRKLRRRGPVAEETPVEQEPERRAPHPRSKKKARRRRR